MSRGTSYEKLKPKAKVPTQGQGHYTMPLCRKENGMARKKKELSELPEKKGRADGRLSTSFKYEGRRYFVYAHTEEELEQKKLEKWFQVKTGQVERENPTLDNYYKRFTDNRRGRVAEMTLRTESFRYKNCADIKIKTTGTRLGAIRIRDIKPSDVQEVQNALSRSGRTTTTVNDSMAHLNHVFNKAMKERLIDWNPCTCIEPLKRKEKPARDTIHRALTIQETAAFFEAAKGNKYYNAYYVMIKSGLRIGELGALMAADIDTRNNIIKVSKTLTKDEVGAYIIGDTPKTDAGNREVPVQDDVIAIIKEQRNWNRLVYGSKVDGTIFKSAEGQLLREFQINREIKRICEKAGIEKFTCHAFRATFATRFIEQRPQDYKILSEILGHSNTKITLDLYTHSMKENKITAMQNIHIAI